MSAPTDLVNVLDELGNRLNMMRVPERSFVSATLFGMDFGRGDRTAFYRWPKPDRRQKRTRSVLKKWRKQKAQRLARKITRRCGS